MRTITLIILHCSATRADRSYSFAQCRRDHLRRGCKDIGYHYYVTRDGHVHAGRPLYDIGAHCHGHNRHSIGICYEGGLDVHGRPADTRTDAQRAALLRLLRRLRKDYPRAIILGHRDLSPDRNGDGRVTSDEWLKQCPCFDAAREYRDLEPKEAYRKT